MWPSLQRSAPPHAAVAATQRRRNVLMRCVMIARFHGLGHGGAHKKCTAANQLHATMQHAPTRRRLCSSASTTTLLDSCAAAPTSTGLKPPRPRPPPPPAHARTHTHTHPYASALRTERCDRSDCEAAERTLSALARSATVCSAAASARGRQQFIRRFAVLFALRVTPAGHRPIARGSEPGHVAGEAAPRDTCRGAAVCVLCCFCRVTV